MDLWNPLTQLESALYRRNIEKTPTSFDYHNHILLGCHLWYIQHPLKHKEVGKYRLVLVQGTRKGRLFGIKLSSQSTLQPIILDKDIDIAQHPSKYLINITGLDGKGSEQTWQIALTTQAEQTMWLDALKRACDSYGIIEASGEADKLKDLAFKMKDGIDVRKRFSRFKFYNRSFEGIRAVKWLMKEKQCTVSQAIAIGNRMLNYGVISHVSSEHLFCAKKLLYRFSVEIDPLTAKEQDECDVEDGEEQGIENMLLSEISNDTNQLLASYHRCLSEVKELQSLLDASNKKYSSAAQKYNSLLTKYRKQMRSIKRLDWFLLVFAVVGCGYLFGWRHYFHSTPPGMSMLNSLSAEISKHDAMAVTTVVVALLLINTVFKRGLIGLILISPSQEDSIPVTPVTAGSSSVSRLDLDAFHLSADDADDDDLYLSDLDNVDDLSGLKIQPPDVSAGEDDSSEEEGDEVDDGDLTSATTTPGRLKIPSSAVHTPASGVAVGSSTSSSFAGTPYSVNTPQKAKSPRLSLLRGRRGSNSSSSESRALARTKSWQVIADLDPPDKWPNNPILVRRSVSMLPTLHQHNHSTVKGSQSFEAYKQSLLKPLHIHKTGPPELSVVPIDTDLFVGNVYFVFANLPDSPVEYFRNKKRKVQYVVQGRFKNTTSFASVYTGQAYSQPLSQLPAKWLLRAIVKILAKFQPALQLSLTGEKPYLISPLVSTAQNIVISKPGFEPKIHTLDIEEDLNLLSPYFYNVPAKKRKQFFAKRSNLQNYNFDPDLVYTFDMYQHMVNFSNFQIDFGFLKYDLLKPLGANPIQMMAVVWDPIADNNIPPEQWQYLYNFEVFHRKSIPQELLLPGVGSTPRRDANDD